MKGSFFVRSAHAQGTTSKKGECTTCNGTLQDCAGHFGYIRLELPVYHMGYFKVILLIMQCICKNCARVLLSDEERRQWLKKFRHPRVEVLQKKAMVKRVAERCKRTRMCYYCGDHNGTVKKLTGTLKLSHDKYGKDMDAKDDVVRRMEAAVEANKEIAQHSSKVADDLNPVRVLWLLERMLDEDCELLDLYYRPERLIVTHLSVPPVAIRPSVVMESAAGSNEDDATMKLAVIIEVNSALRLGIQKGLPMPNLVENWDFLQLQVGLYINSELPGLPLAAQPTKPTRGFVQRLKGKQGRFRQNLSGKRVDFSGRTVISPDPNLKISEVAVPMHMAQLLTFPEAVSRHNIHKLRQLVINGTAKYPGANFVLYPNGHKWFLKYGDRRRVAAELKYGDIVERHLEDGDMVLFNRQPSLHRMSIMCHRARVMPWKTLRFNESVCNPYNADFDGDEMNMHVPQTEEARTEALLLMGVENNLCTPKNGDILVASTQDFLTSAFLITRRDTFYDRASFCLLCSYMTDGAMQVDIPTPALLKPVELWTGKQLMSVLVRPSAHDRVFVTLGVPEKTYSKKGGPFCVNDGFVFFRNSELLSGQLGKATLGNGSKQGLFALLMREYSPQVAAVCMNRLAKLSARWIGNHGFSIGIDDVQPSKHLYNEKQRAVEEGYDASLRHIQAFNEGRLTLQPGCNAAQTLEANITGELNKIREEAGKAFNEGRLTLQPGCNAAQTLEANITGELNEIREEAGKVRQESGLTPTEFVFHTMGGREGLVDTAVKTAETGYMSRRLMKALEDLSVAYDGTVRNASGGIVQMRYGDDGMDPAHMEGSDGGALNLDRTFTTCQVGGGVDGRMMGKGVVWRWVVEGWEGGRHGTMMAWAPPTAHIEGTEFEGKKEKVLDRGVAEKVARNLCGVTAKQLQLFLDTCIHRYQSKRMEPGTAVGAIGAQSIGEPGTQMTLKTFHFAGVASMNVTLGVPRIKEIINAAKNISTPIVTVKLETDNDVKAARIVKGRVEKTTLGEVVKSMKTVLTPSQAMLSIRLDMHRISALQLEITAYTVADAITSASRLRMKLKAQHIRVVSADKLLVYSPEQDRRQLLFSLHSLRKKLPQVMVKGIASVERAVINDLGGGKYNLLVEGTNFGAVLGVTGVDGCRTKSNHVMEVESVLGIEAARHAIMHEINYTMGSHGMTIDPRHMMLLADVMTYKGEVLGITRFGIAKMKDSVLMLASFEKTTDHLFDAAVHGRKDEIEGVSECIIMGIPMPVGTGLFKLKQKVDHIPVLPKRPPLLLG
ncbi:unnamed protein product [Closterium sp. Yama58-4]|nr:unnamed protein product [Closterium sp. Yama58-4]